ncbi:MAG: hypothetical protein KDA24_02060 [Deltaproteobacteria bacterium]|nr:hypothetical protein [Deltaproteobacteria bacterium]
MGATVLGLILAVGILLPSERVTAGFEPPDQPDSIADAVAIGWQIPATCADPLAWEALPAVGPSRAAVLSRAAADGALRSPSDLLQVPGIGIKMAALLTPRIRFPSAERAVGGPDEEPR